VLQIFHLEQKIWQPIGAEADATWLIARRARRRRIVASNSRHVLLSPREADGVAR
jgi:hypothetical protein